MRLMITRPLEDAEPLAAELAALGVETVIEPLLSIELTAADIPDLTGVQGLLLTSANGVRAFAALSPERHLPVYAVGDATARTALQAGFEKITSAAGDVTTLAELVQQKCQPGDGVLLHVAGSKVAGDLAAMLALSGYQYHRVQLYHASKATSLSPGGLDALKKGDIDGVVLYSPRTAGSFVDLLEKAGAADCAKQLNVYCLSDAVAARAGALGWARMVVAASPDQVALIKSVREMIPQR
ncbi:MAG: uroporphyrinogen-III synthase [Rhodospirillales bacterium]|nr:uroporphyrinogen-III synthase [Rhodospirillales bacterium]